MGIWDFNCPECGQRGRDRSAEFRPRGVVPEPFPGAGSEICECARCGTLLRIGPPWYFFGARPHVVSPEVLDEARERESTIAPGAARGRLLDALARLSAAPGEQEQYLATIDAGHLADELVREVMDVLALGEVACGVGDRGAEFLSAIGHHVDEMNERPEVWEAAALVDAPEWEEMRRLARIAADDVRRGW